MVALPFFSGCALLIVGFNSCRREGMCVASYGYPSMDYSNFQACSISFDSYSGPTTIDVISFDTESCCNCDSINVDGDRYCGSNPSGLDGLITNDKSIWWRSDRSLTRGGWKLCFSNRPRVGNDLTVPGGIGLTLLFLGLFNAFSRFPIGGVHYFWIFWKYPAVQSSDVVGQETCAGTDCWPWWPSVLRPCHCFRDCCCAECSWVCTSFNSAADDGKDPKALQEEFGAHGIAEKEHGAMVAEVQAGLQESRAATLARYRTRLKLYLKDNVLDPDEIQALKEEFGSDAITKEEHEAAVAAIKSGQTAIMPSPSSTSFEYLEVEGASQPFGANSGRCARGQATGSRKCSHKPFPGRLFCKNHLCPHPGCSASKSSNVHACPKHLPSGTKPRRSSSAGFAGITFSGGGFGGFGSISTVDDDEDDDDYARFKDPETDGAPTKSWTKLRLQEGFIPQENCRMSLLLAGDALGVTQLVDIVEGVVSRLDADGVDETHPEYNSRFAMYMYTYGNPSTKDAEQFYYVLNAGLRARKPKWFKLWQPYIYYLTKALDELEPVNIVVYKGMKLTEENKKKYDVQGKKRIHFSGFSSTTTDEAVAHRFTEPGGLILKIDVQDAKDIQPYSWYGKGESEFLLPPNMEYIQTGTKLPYDRQGRTYINLEQLPGEKIYM